jgi:hypothetical protein
MTGFVEKSTVLLHFLHRMALLVENCPYLLPFVHRIALLVENCPYLLHFVHRTALLVEKTGLYTTVHKKRDRFVGLSFGCPVGFEPTTFRTTI